jgi:predicted MFS family arabinose efflux permease
MTELVQSASASAGALGARRRYWTLSILALVAFLATVDRQAFSILLVPIQSELRVSDAAMGFLMGTAFSVAQAIFSLPLGRLADRTNRRNLLAVALAVWSIATALSGLASSFVALLLARLVVGAAEAAQTPTTASLVSDLFRTGQRGSAFTFCSAGMALGVAFGSYASGTLSDLFGWNVALFVVGLPGLLVAAILYLTVPEPPRTGLRSRQPDAVHTPAMLQLLRQCLAIRTVPPFILGFAALHGAVMGWFVWFPVFLMRIHGLSAAETGSVFGMIILCGVLSAMWGGPMSDLLARRGARWRIYFIVAVTVLSIPLIFASSVVPSLIAAQVCAMGFTLFAGGYHPVAMAIYASVSPPNIRGSVSALVYLAALVGGAVVPFAFGLANDALSRRFGDEAVRFTLLLAPVLLVAAATLFWSARQSVEKDIVAAESPNAGP